MIHNEKLANKNILFVNGRFIKLKFGTLLIVKLRNGNPYVVRYSGFNHLGNLFFKEFYTLFSNFSQGTPQTAVGINQVEYIELLTKATATNFFSKAAINETVRNILNELDT